MSTPQNPAARFLSLLQEGKATAADARELKRWLNGNGRTQEERDAGEMLLGLFEEEDNKRMAQQQEAERERQRAKQQQQTQKRAHHAAGQKPSQLATKVFNRNRADATCLGESFHNPYTFIPFPDQPLGERVEPTALSIDEVEKDRFTGVLDLQVELLSPLLTSEAQPYQGQKENHQKYHALCIGNDVVLPATGVRGSLRTLMSILTGGTLGYVDEEAWLCQGRDARLGPRNPKTREPHIPQNPILAEVIQPGGVNKSGRIRMGTTRLVKLQQLDGLCGQDLVNRMRPEAGSTSGSIYVDEQMNHHSLNWSDVTPWRVKLSGRPINLKGKREGLFLSNGREIQLPASFWAAYAGRNRHGDFPELRPGDLVWVQPKTPDTREEEILDSTHIESIQWARWGRKGERLLEAVSRYHPDQLPDCFNPDGKVDEVTNLFGQVPRDTLVKDVSAFQGKSGKPAAAFAARIRTGNLIFPGGKSNLETSLVLAPLAPPHPGCSAFYRQPKAGREASFADEVKNGDFKLRGFKVYRTQKPTDRPWDFSQQGVCTGDGKIDTQREKKVNKTVDLLKGGTGHLRLSLRGLNDRELALLLAACSVDWRLGGGKPFGLGHARIRRATLLRLDDDGNLNPEPDGQMVHGENLKSSIPARFRNALETTPDIWERLALYQTSQVPVEKLRYPRAAVCNNKKVNRGGHVWFNRHASPHKSGHQNEEPQGLEILHVSREATGILQGKAPGISAQPLPLLQKGRPEADVLYGYDLYSDDNPGSGYREDSKGTAKPQKRLEGFDPNRHPGRPVQAGEHQGQTRQTRQQNRHNRR